MQTTSLSLFRAAGLLTASLAVLSAPLAAAADNTDAFPQFDSYIKVSGQAASITGDSSAFQARSGQDDNGGIGIEDLHYSRDIAKDTTMLIDGRALAGSEDYLLHVNVAKTDVGSFDVGYKTFRTFYDGVGGFYPGSNAWLPLANQDLHVDRGQFWAETKIALPNSPEFTLRYVNETRTGQKDSTIWGDDTALTTGSRIVPAWLQLDESHQSFEASMKQTLANTTYQLKLFGDWVNNTDTLNVNDTPLVSQLRENSTKTFGVMASTVTDIGATSTFRTGLRAETVDDKFSGSSTPAGARHRYIDLIGGTTAKLYTGTLGYDFTPVDSLLVDVGLKAEHRDAKSNGTYTDTQAAPTPHYEVSRSSDNALTPELNLNYSGFRSVALYASASHRYSSGSHDYSTGAGLVVPAVPQFALSPQSDNGDYKVGATWRQSDLLTLRAEVFYKDHQFKSAGFRSTTTSAYYLLGSRFGGATISAAVTPIDTLTFTTRYTYQEGDMQVTGSALTSIDSMDASMQTISESVNWTPVKQFYMQANADLVYNVISTSFPQSGSRVVGDSNNNYCTCSILAGAVITKRDDLQVMCTYYRAFDGDPYLSTYTLPYGASATEVTVSVGLKHKVSDRMIANGKVGYYDSSNNTTGGQTNFHGPLAYVSLEYGL